MPFAWTAIHLLNIVSSVGGLDRSDPDSDSGAANSVASHLICIMWDQCAGVCIANIAIFWKTFSTQRKKVLGRGTRERRKALSGWASRKICATLPLSGQQHWPSPISSNRSGSLCCWQWWLAPCSILLQLPWSQNDANIWPISWKVEIAS